MPRSPFRAASLSNAGIAHRILGAGGEADDTFRQGEQAWEDLVANIAALDVPVSGASSSFHFRLAAKAPDALVNARRARYRHLAEAALAITRFNRFLINGRDVVAQRVYDLKMSLSETLGCGSPEVRLLSAPAEAPNAASVLAIYAEKAADFRSRQRTLSNTLSEDCEKLEAASSLTMLLAPQIVAVKENGKKQDERRLRNSMSLS